MKSFFIKIFILLCALFTLTGALFVYPNTSKAIPPSCGYSLGEGPSLLSTDFKDDGKVTIQCGIGPSIWLSIRGRAIYSNSTSSINNFNGTGGSRQALSDFYKMPGNVKQQGGGVLTKTYEGKTITYYPKATSTKTPTLQYPATNDRAWDKIRYYQ